MTIVELGSTLVNARVSTDGGELVGLTHKAAGDILWQVEPDVWTFRAPVLFPIVGRVRDDEIRVEGRRYPMTSHGFARTSAFEILEARPERCRLRLADSDATRLRFPYAFRLELEYRITDTGIACEARVGNPGNSALPMSFGFHPAFRWPLSGGDRAGHWLAFDGDAPLVVSRVRGDGLQRDVSVLELSPDGRLELEDALFDEGAVVLVGSGREAVRYVAPDGFLIVEVRWTGLPDLGIWSRPPAGLLCIEPWHGYSDPIGFTGEFCSKPGLASVSPGCVRQFTMEIAVHDARPRP